MTRPVVLFAVDMDPERRRIAEGRLTGRAEILIRRDLSDVDLSRRAPDVDVLVTGGFPRGIPAEGWPTRARLRLPQPPAAGVAHLPYDRIPPAVTICSNAGAYRVSISEHSMALLLAAAKNLIIHTDAIHHGRFPQDVMGISVRGKTLGIIGLGGGGGGDPRGDRGGGGARRPPPPPRVGPRDARDWGQPSRDDGCARRVVRHAHESRSPSPRERFRPPLHPAHEGNHGPHGRAGASAPEAECDPCEHSARKADPGTGPVPASEGEPGLPSGTRCVVALPAGGGISLHRAVPRTAERRDDAPRRVGDPRTGAVVPRGCARQRRAIPLRRVAP